MSSLGRVVANWWGQIKPSRWGQVGLTNLTGAAPALDATGTHDFGQVDRFEFDAHQAAWVLEGEWVTPSQRLPWSRFASPDERRLIRRSPRCLRHESAIRGVGTLHSHAG